MDEELKKARRRARKIVEQAREDAIKIIADAAGRQVEEAREEIALDLEEAAIKEMKDMAEAIRDQVLASQANVEAKLEQYKKERMAQIDSEVKSLVEETAKRIIRNVLGQAIDIRGHEDLVMKAIEDAKRGGIF